MTYSSFSSVETIFELSKIDPAAADAALRELAARRERGTSTSTTPGDPLQTDKIKVARYLKRFDLALSDLQDNFWDQDDRNTRGLLLGQIVGPVMAERRAAEGLERRLKRLTACGYPADYYSRPPTERRQISANVRQQRHRAKRTLQPAAPVPLPTEAITRASIANMLAQLQAWTKGTSASARKLRGREIELVKVAVRYQELTHKLGREPSQAELANKIGCTRRAAQNRIGILARLHSPGGPWHSQA